MNTKGSGFVLSTLLAGAVIFACAGKPPADIGVANGRLAPCPDSPNCVSSQSEGQKHFIDPMVYSDDRAAARQRLKRVIAEMPGTRIITDTNGYLHAEFKSRIMGFVDDVEFYFPEESLIHVRSASRMGYSDLGVNRRRIETIRQRFNTLSP